MPEMLHDNSKTRFAAILAFLRHTLSERPVPVNLIETAAHEAGLLGEGQRLTHAKRFKRAKAMLGIRSTRIGFGADGDWFWQLPRLNDSVRAAHDAFVNTNMRSRCHAGPEPCETEARRSGINRTMIFRLWATKIASQLLSQPGAPGLMAWTISGLLVECRCTAGVNS